jgi:hypothetical protein
MADDIDLIGSPDEVRAFVAAYETAGVEEPVVMPLPWGGDRMAVIDDTIRAVARAEGGPGGGGGQGA